MACPRRTVRRLALAALPVAAVVSTAAACSRAPLREPAATILPVSLPDLIGAHPSVRDEAARRHEALLAALARQAPAGEQAERFGELGMLLQAAGFTGAAEPALVSAHTLVPADPRWPYYLGHLYRNRGDAARAERWLARALELRPGDLPTLVWLGRLLLDRADVEQAARRFGEAAAIAPDSAAVLEGLGRVELAKRNFAAAAGHVERALRLDPAAESLHAPLAVAYRSLGDTARAERYQGLWSGRPVHLPDPLQQELDLLLETGLSNELRGVKALAAQDWKAAAAYFRKGLELTPDNTLQRRSLLHKLGTALFLDGDSDGARRQFEEAIRLAPAVGLDDASGKAYYSLGVIRMGEGRTREALDLFKGAVRYQPSYLEAHLALADALGHLGRRGESLAHYEAALAIDPFNPQASTGYVLALAGLERWAAARRHLEEVVRGRPDRSEASHMLARLLAVAPAGGVQDAARALEVLRELVKTGRTTDRGETIAMALAALGRFDEAVSVQREVLAAVRQAGGAAAAVQRVEQNLRLYERRQPVRVFWPDDAFLPPAARGTFAANGRAPVP